MLQGSELIIILLVALVVFGPERLPGIARKLGGWVGEVRKAVSDMSASLESEVKDVQGAAADAVAPVRRLRSEISPTAGIEEAVRGVRQAVEGAAVPLQWVGPEPTSGPRPNDALDDLAEIERTGGPVTDLPDVPAADG